MEILKKYKYLVLIALILLVAGFGFYFYSNTKTSQSNLPVNVEEKNINFKLVINTGENKYEFSGIAKEDETVFDALKKISSVNNFSLIYKESDLGAFIEEIYGVKNDTAANKYWMFKINGQLANEGASTYKIKDNDNIEWYYGEVNGY